MINSLIGIIIILSEFFLIANLYKKTQVNYHLYSLITLILGNFTLGIILQLFKIFSFYSLIAAHLIAIGILIYFKAHKNIKYLFDYKKIDIIFIIVLIISLISLYQVHFSYTGSLSKIENSSLLEVKNEKLTYPFYSDEWVGVSVTNYVLNHGVLPFVNPFSNGSYFPNLEFAFHSFLSEIFLLFHLSPITNYTLVSLFISLLTISLVYWLLRYLELGKFSSAIGALSILYIVSGSNLPGIWHLIPVNLGIIMMLIGFCFIALNKKKESIIMTIPTLLFYPPLMVFYIPSLIAYLWKHNEDKNIFKKNILFLTSILIATGIILSLGLIISHPSFMKYIESKLIYQSFTPTGIPNYSPLTIIPIWALILGILGLISNFKKRLWLTIPSTIGVLYWVLYSQVMFRIIIEYQRVILVESILVCILSAVFLKNLLDYIKEENILSSKWMNTLKIIILGLFLIFSFSYTHGERWNNLTLQLNENHQKVSPSAPATIYLNNQDLAAFSNISEKRFLSEPRKSLAIAAVTGNYPLETKPSTITSSIISYETFMKSDCQNKTSLAKKYKIDYVYSPEFNCPNFIQVKSSGLFKLYQFKK